MRNICEKCQIVFEAQSFKRFCSRSCANSRNWTQADKDNKSKAAKESIKVLKSNRIKAKNNRVAREDRKCPYCGGIFTTRHKSEKKFCSSFCSHKGQSNRGGHRINSGKAKTGYIRGIYCGSTWELAYALYNLDHQIPLSRFPYTLVSEKYGKYLPDFLQDHKIIEIKGYWTKGVDRKIKVARENGYECEILYKDQLQPYFDYVKSKYNFKECMSELYDDWKPQFVFECVNCNAEFSRLRKPKTREVFCSRKCAGQYRRRSL
jgi:ribosomal protein S27AE